MLLFFSDKPGHKTIVGKLAVIWTIVILLLCFLPANEVPDVQLPLIDKWVHFILFGLFSFLWLSSLRNFKTVHLLVVFLIAVLYGWLVEVLQGALSFLGRSQDDMDTLADGLGGLLGVVIFYTGYRITRRKEKKRYV